jgi:hypothetical protein
LTLYSTAIGDALAVFGPAKKKKPCQLSIINNNPLKWERECHAPAFVLANKQQTGNMKRNHNHHCHHVLEHEEQANAIISIVLWNMKRKQAHLCAPEHEEAEFCLEFPLNLSAIMSSSSSLPSWNFEEENSSGD